MKILLVTEYFPTTNEGDFRGGVEACAFYLAKHLAARGHVITVLASHQPGQPRDASVAAVRVIRIGRTRPYTQRGSLIARMTFVRGAIEVAKHVDADVVDGHSFLGMLPAWFVARHKHVPAIATCHDVWIGDWAGNVGMLSGLAGEVFERYALTLRWDRVIVHSEATKRKLLERTRISSDTITVVPNGVDWKALRSIAQSKFDRPSVAYAGRLVGYKHVDALLRAAARIRRAVPDLQVKIVGGGPERGKLERLAGELGIRDNVQFLGFVPRYRDVLATIGRSHVFCFPSTVEGFGIAVLEAMALGVPYVSSDISAIREVTGGYGGILTPPGSVDALAEGILKTLKQEVPSGRAEGWVRQFDWAILAERLEHVYRQATLRSSGPAPVEAGGAAAERAQL